MIKLPPMHHHPEPMVMKWSPLERAAIRARDIEVARCVLEVAAVVAGKYFHFTTAKQIRAIKIEGETP